ncbi:MAG: helix-turn-helix transcriptional regulator [Candidatus Margulisbacteria bacterium]|nr:helix-turn-helix transcriptional regulator [Candidatus Margulisiibacteriota bacterium]
MDKDNIEKHLKKLISSKLKQIKKQRKMTIEQMAAEVGIEYSAFYNIYEGNALPRLATLYAISSLYDLPIEFLFKDISIEKQSDIIQKIDNVDLVQTYRKLDNETQRVLLSLMKSHIQRRKI